MIQPNLSSPAYYSLDHAVGLSQNLDFNLLSFFLLITYPYTLSDWSPCYYFQLWLSIFFGKSLLLLDI